MSDFVDIGRVCIYARNRCWRKLSFFFVVNNVSVEHQIKNDVSWIVIKDTLLKMDYYKVLMAEGLCDQDLVSNQCAKPQLFYNLQK